MKRVLILSAHFPPDSSAAAHRVRLLAPHLPSFGWEPTVLTVAPQAYEAKLDPLLATTVPDWLRVIRAPAWAPAVTRRVGFGDLGLRSLAGMWHAASALVATERFDALLITIYPAYTAMLGPLLQRKFSIPFVLDYQDPWVGSWGRSVGAGPNGAPDARSRATRHLAGWLEPIVVRRAAALTAVSAATYEQVVIRNPRIASIPTETLPLGWERADRDWLDRHGVANPYFTRGDGRIHFCYVGTLLPNGIETVRTLLGALAQLRRTHADAGRVLLHFFGTSNQTTVGVTARVRPLADALGVADAVHEVPERIPYADGLRVLCDADAVLLLGSTERHYTASKVFPALIARRPILALFHEASSVCDVLDRLGTAPAVRLIRYSDRGPADVSAEVERQLALACSTNVADPAFDFGAVQDVSARAVAGRLAGVLERATAGQPTPAES